MTKIVINKDISLKCQKINFKMEAESLPVNHIIWIDCSGSMSDQLPLISKHLKNKLPILVKDIDTITLGWFSGKNEFGILQQEIEIKNLTDLTPLNQAIDRFLKPINLTSFKQPFEETLKVIDEILNNRKGSAISFFFLTDGNDNQSKQTDILEICVKLREKINSATIVEYGYYCDREFLKDISTLLNGNLVFSENFNKYEPVLENSLQKEVSNKFFTYILNDIPQDNFVFSIDKNNNVYKHFIDIVSKYKYIVKLPIGTKEIFYVTKTNKESFENTEFIAKNYPKFIIILISLYFYQNNFEMVNNLLISLGDVKLYNKYINSFGKQDLMAFQDTLLETVKWESYYEEGYSNNLSETNKFCVLDLFKLLSSDKNNLWYPNHKSFEYRRIGVKTIQADTSLNSDEKIELDNLLESLKSEKSLEKIDNLLSKIKAITDSKQQIKFEYEDKNKGYPINDLIWHKTRSNLSIQVTYQGSVNLPKNDLNLPEIFQTFIFRNYTIIKDGIINVKHFPVSFGNKEIYEIIKKEGLLTNNEEYELNKIFVLDLSKLTILNRSMIKNISAAQTCYNSYLLLKLEASNKVLKYYKKHFFPEQNTDLLNLYGLETTVFLTKLGITDNGFQPKVIQEKSGESYQAIEFDIKIKGASSLPSITKLKDKIEKNSKLNLSDRLMKNQLEELEVFLKSIEHIENIIDKDKRILTYLNNKISLNKDKIKEISYDMAQTKFAIILGNIWFQEFSGSLDDSSKTCILNFDNEYMEFLFDIKHVEIDL